MFVLPRSILFFSQVLGILPLTVPKQSTRMMEFSFPVFIWQLILFFLRCVMSLVVCCYDVWKYVGKQPFLMNNNERMFTTVSRLIPLEILGCVSLFSSKSNYSTLIEMCKVLGRVDANLGIKQKIENKTSTNCFFIFIYLTVIIIMRNERSIRFNINSILYTPIYLIYYIQSDVFLQFTFVAKSLKKRFKITNQKIRNVAMSRPTNVKQNKRVLHALKGKLTLLRSVGCKELCVKYREAEK